MDALDKLQIAESLDLVLEYAKGKLTEIQDNCKTGTVEEYDRYKEALTDVESVVLDYIGQFNNK